MSLNAGVSERRAQLSPRGLAFRYTLQQPVSLVEPMRYQHVERWDVSVQVDDPQHEQNGRTIGDARVIVLNLEPGRDIGDLVDRVSGEWHEGVRTGAAGPVAPGQAPTEESGRGGVQHLLVLDRVWVEGEYRGHGLGPVIAAVVIDRLSRGCGMAACYPAPFEGECRPEDRPREVAALSRIWATVGFSHWRDGVWMLDLEGPTAGLDLARLLGKGRSALDPDPGSPLAADADRGPQGDPTFAGKGPRVESGGTTGEMRPAGISLKRGSSLPQSDDAEPLGPSGRAS